MNQAVENGVGDGGLTERVVPMTDRELTGDNGGAELVTVLDDLEQISCLFGSQRPQREVVKDEDVDLGPGRHQARQTAIGTGESKVAEHAWSAQVERGVTATQGGVSKSASDVGLAAAGGSGDEDVAMRWHPLRVGQAEHQRAIQAAWAVEVEVLKAQVELSRLVVGFQPYEEPSRAERDLSPMGRSHR